MDLERTIAAFRWRMGLIAQEDETARQDWEVLERWILSDEERVRSVTAQMAEPLVGILHSGLFEEPGASYSWNALRSYLERWPALQNTMVDRSASYVHANLNEKNFGPLVKEQEPAMSVFQSGDDQEAAVDAGQTRAPEDEEATIPIETPSPTQPIPEPEPEPKPEPELESIAPQIEEPAPDPVPVNTAEQEPQPTVEPAVAATAESGQQPITAQPDQTNSSAASQAAAWKYIAVPEGPNKHEEFFQLTGESPEGLKIIGARVRGKKHKHEGTNCDDWFEFGVSGSWTIIAVSDGAGSKIFSRIGAKESCRAAKAVLSEALANHQLKGREQWSNATFKRNKQTGEFAEEDLEHVQRALHEAMKAAYDRVEATARDLAESSAHAEILKRTPVIEDFSGTLLLAVHTTVIHDEAERSFVLTCQIGDGMLAAINVNGGLQLLGEPDSGEYAGQTDFLTSRKKVEKANLTSKTFPFFGPMQALMVMTDGVADDYFPNDPGMMELYGDLAINGILQLRGMNRELMDSALATTQLKNTDAVANARLSIPVEAITPDGPRPVFIRSVVNYANKLGLPLAEVIKSTPLLVAGTICDRGEEMCPETESEDMLRVWLDSYYARGSFDDRTLVVLYREAAA